MKKIIIYTIPNCPHCEKVKNFLKERDILFEEIDVLKNKTFAREMIIKSGQKNVPVLDIDGKIIFRENDDTAESLKNKIREKLK